MARSRPSGGSSFLRLGLVRGFASEYAPHRGAGALYLLADASPLGTAISSSTDLRKGERRWTTGKGEHGARTGRIAGHPQQGDDPGLPAHRAPAVRKGHYRPEHVT